MAALSIARRRPRECVNVNALRLAIRSRPSPRLGALRRNLGATAPPPPPVHPASPPRPLLRPPHARAATDGFAIIDASVEASLRGLHLSSSALIARHLSSS
ncbi:unnamed protein product, partial [Iphiclides podalirius]